MRAITLIDVVVAITIKNRLEKKAESLLEEYQCGSRKNSSVTEQIFPVNQIQDNQNSTVNVVFLEFKQVYYSLNRDDFCITMGGLGIPRK